MTNLKTTIKTLSIAAAVSFSMNAMAITVTNLGSGFDSDASAGSGLGHAAIGNMNSILSSIGSTGGKSISSTDYWSAFIGTGTETYFNYAVAKPMIEELVYTVDGKTFHEESGLTVTGNSLNVFHYNKQTGKYNYREDLTGGEITYAQILNSFPNATDPYEAAGYSAATTAQDIAWAAKGSVSGNSGNVVDGHIDVSFAAGKAVLSHVGATGFDASSENNATTTLNSMNTNGSIDVTTARLNVAAYDNANDLIKLIADQNKTGKTLDVLSAAQDLQVVINAHNGFLSATIRQEAIALKAALKNMGIQTAASAVGQGALEACDDQFADGVTVELACTAIGTQFSTLAGQISTASAGDYNNALTALQTYADNIVGFNTGAANGYDSANAAAEITGEFGVITSTLDQTLFGIDFGNAVGAGVSVDGDDFEFSIGTADGTGSITK